MHGNIGNTLIDNSEQLKLVDTLNKIISESEINEICIATGYCARYFSLRFFGGAMNKTRYVFSLTWREKKTIYW